MRIPATGWRLSGRLAAGLATTALAGCMAVSAGTARPGSGGGSVVVTHSGAVRGKTVSGVREFLGIPYAAPPTGSRRWRPPQQPARWSGVRTATAFGAHCPQGGGAFGSASGTSEDCLFLNVFTKRAGPPRRPVMVWIHGGALVGGESDSYNPASLVNDGVTVVTVNYRLGALGFLADAALAGKNGSAGNYGLMDQQAALRWVRANIAAFGGNPRDVTLFGESAGGLSTLSQLVSPGAAGLFRRAIVESGSYDLTQAPLAGAEAAGAAFAAKVGCSGKPGDAATAACLRAVPVSKIVASQNSGGYTPDIDGVVLRQSIGTALKAGRFHRVPVIMGTNHDEWRLFVALARLGGAPPVTAASYTGQLQGLLGVSAAEAAQVEARYPVSRFASPSIALGAVGTDAIFACPSLKAVSYLSRFTPTFSYEFSDESAPSMFPASVGFPLGAAHASELPYLFDPVPPAASRLKPAQQALSARMKAYWTSMAKSGSPRAAAQPRWPSFSTRGQRVLTLDEPVPAVHTNFAAAHQCAFWANEAAAGIFG